MRWFIMFALILSVSMSYAKEDTAFVKDGRIVVDTKDGQKIVDFTLERGHRVYNLQNNIIKEEVSIVDEALKVFEKKAFPVYNKKLWIYSKIDDQSQTYVDFMTNKYNEDIVFSPEGDFVYYQELTPEGKHNVYGVKIGTQEKFFVNTANSFYIETCDNGNSSYIVTSENGEISGYHVFDLEGGQVDIASPINDINDLTNVICY